jgi:sensor c-di-GMP phosphodiesterase-like protein
LARWVRPDGTVLPPSRFIQLAVDSGRIDAMTWQLLSAALHELQPRMRQDKAFKLSVNIVPRHFVTAGFLDDLRRIVAEAKVSPRQIVVELTEREDFEDLEHAAALVAELRDFGFRVAIDDVGIGHNGLSHIQSLGANILKIDKFFIDSIDRDGTANAVVEMLVRLAKQLGMSVVAEGIEAEDQIAALVACGVTNGQGFVVSPPLPVGRFLEFLDRRSPGAADGPAATRATRAA